MCFFEVTQVTSFFINLCTFISNYGKGFLL